MTDKIDLDKDVNLNADELEQVKGGGVGDKTTPLLIDHNGKPIRVNR